MSVWLLRGTFALGKSFHLYNLSKLGNGFPSISPSGTHHMLKQLAASHAAKSLALCVCPVVTAGVVATKEPHVRRMIHKATAPRTPERKRAALANVSLPPCTPVAPFATLPRVAAALPAAAGIPPDGLTQTAASSPEAIGSTFNPGFGAPGAFIPGPGGSIGGGGFIPGGPGGGNPISPPTSPVSGVPEPETWVQVLGGLALVGGGIRYFRQRKQTVNV